MMEKVKIVATLLLSKNDFPEHFCFLFGNDFPA